MRFEETKYGFNYGAAEVQRLVCDERKGWVVMGIKTARQSMQVYVTKTGKVRVFDVKDGEWTPPKRKAKR